ncbi:Uncharacterised protein [Pandoraea pulmonicola]|uniref:Uncharacterized protein n=1 Tax=Pandoraea pulmonicola TaxID=93221 RepID=A0AAJ5CZX9_PANPU|nr:Uncharacterised protein [Pandoraea pulmonicola]
MRSPPSAIDVAFAKAGKSKPGAIDFAYKAAPLRILANGHAVQVNQEPGSAITCSEL